MMERIENLDFAKVEFEMMANNKELCVFYDVKAAAWVTLGSLLAELNIDREAANIVMQEHGLVDADGKWDSDLLRYGFLFPVEFYAGTTNSTAERKVELVLLSKHGADYLRLFFKVNGL